MKGKEVYREKKKNPSCWLISMDSGSIY